MLGESRNGVTLTQAWSDRQKERKKEMEKEKERMNTRRQGTQDGWVFISLGG